MPYCRHCHQEITKFDTDICPYCGGDKPIATGYKTMDITRPFKPVGGDYAMPKTRSQKTFCLLCALVGYFGVHDFYIFRAKRGLLDCLLSIAFVLAVGLPLFFTGAFANALAFVLPFALVWLFHVILAILYWKVESPKDGKGDFLR